MDQVQAAVPEVRFDNREEKALQEQLGRGDLTGLRAYMARTREQHEWQDRVFLLERLIPSIRPAALDFACDAEPEAADLQVVRAVFFSYLARTSRGSGTCEKITDEGWKKAGEAIQKGLEVLNRVTRLDAGDPTAYTSMLSALMIFGQTMPLMQRAFQHSVQLAPDLVPAHQMLVNAFSKRWYGKSHEDSLKVAREAMKRAGPGSDMAACLFWAHKLIRAHYEFFDKDEKAAEEYAQNPEVRRELSEAFDRWVAPPYVPRRSSVAYLGWAGSWFFRVRDRERVRRVLELTGGDYATNGWESEPHRLRAELFAAGKSNPNDKPDPVKHCLVMLGMTAARVKEGGLGTARASLEGARQLEAKMSSEESAVVKPLILLYESLLCRIQKKTDDSRRLREEALRLLEGAAPVPDSKLYHELLARAFTWMEDWRSAIPYWEQTITMRAETLDDLSRGEMLLELGNCYQRAGLRDHAAIPLRSAVEVYRAAAGDPHLPEALLSLGNALRKSSPEEAEELYREAAELYSSQMKLQSATGPWVNLGVLYSESGRYVEAAELYDRVLRIREQTPGTKPGRVASVLNNIASNYRRMGKWREAHAAIDRAIKLLVSGDGVLSSALSTRGMIFLDEGDDKNAAKWLQDSVNERRRHTSPDETAIAEDLERLAGALTRLGKTKQAAAARQDLDALRAKLSATPVSELECKPDVEIAGAVLIELTGVGRLRERERYDNVAALVGKVLKLIRLGELGDYRGKVSIRESTTLIFHSNSPETLWSVLEPCVIAEPVAAGAIVTIRDGSVRRQVVVHMPASAVN